MVTDFIVVGQGLAGTVMTHTLRQRGLSVLVVDRGHENSSSAVAAGIYNPITGRNFVKTWMADTLFPLIEPFYTLLENELGEKLLYPMPILRPYHTIDKQNTILSKSKSKGAAKYYGNHYAPDQFPFLKDARGVLETVGSGYLAVDRLIRCYREKLKREKLIFEDNFEMDAFHADKKGVTYKEHKAKAAILCLGHSPALMEGDGSYTTVPVKGEILTIKATGLPQQQIVNQGVFILPLGNGLWRLGSTYESGSADAKPTEKGKEELLNKMAQLVNVEMKVVAHDAGIRPATVDRFPIVGKYPDISNLYVLNGLGAKGVSIAPWLAGHLADHILNNETIERAADIKRYRKAAK